MIPLALGLIGKVAAAAVLPRVVKAVCDLVRGADNHRDSAGERCTGEPSIRNNPVNFVDPDGLEPGRFRGGSVDIIFNQPNGSTTAQGTWSGGYQPGSGTIFIDAKVRNPLPVPVKAILEVTGRAYGEPGGFGFNSQWREKLKKLGLTMSNCPGRSSKLPVGPEENRDEESGTFRKGELIFVHGQTHVRQGSGERSVDFTLTIYPQGGSRSLRGGAVYSSGRGAGGERAIFIESDTRTLRFNSETLRYEP